MMENLNYRNGLGQFTKGRVLPEEMLQKLHAHRTQNATLNLICPNCNKEFQRLRCLVNRTDVHLNNHFCSHKCYGEYRDKMNYKPWNKDLIINLERTDNHGVPPNWRRKILERDNYICQKCGYKENLHIHHKIEFKIIKKHTLDNLITLCEKCHYKEHNWKFAGKGPEQV